MTTYDALRLPAVLVLGTLASSSSLIAEAATDPYDALYDVLMTRYGPDGKAYAQNETSPALYSKSRFPFDDKTHPKLRAALDTFDALPQSKIESYSDVQRALLQRHLWKVFDESLIIRWTSTSRSGIAIERFLRPRHSDRRKPELPKIASIIRKLALPKKRILALPNPLAATVASKKFPREHDAKDLLKPFLPAGLLDDESDWVCLGEKEEAIPADAHSEKFKWRSAFLSFMRAPGGRGEARRRIGLINKETEHPVGTQLALVERAFLISDEGELVLSPLVVSVSLRAFVGYDERQAIAAQAIAEFLMQPRRMIAGDPVMRPLGPKEHRFEAGGADSPGGGITDPFEVNGSPTGIRSRLSFCSACHINPSRISRRRLGVGTARIWRLKEDRPELIIQATLDRKKKDDSWIALQSFWPNAPEIEEKSPAVQSTSATAYDALYDALMLRKSADGKTQGHNESTPMVYGRSEFPFDPKSYPKFDAALREFESLPQSEIENFSDVHRALLQRHLWAAFDATFLRPDSIDRKHNPNRDKPRARISRLVRRLALPAERIQALPQTGIATVKSSKLPKTHDPKNAFARFLPDGLFDETSAWVRFGRTDGYPAYHHHRFKYWRSAFFQFIRAPERTRERSTALLEGINRGEVFPVGTQFVLVEQAFLISDQGEMVLSPLVIGMQFRAYLNVEKGHHESIPKPTQSLAEFVLEPNQLKIGKLALKSLAENDVRWKAFTPGDGGKVDPFEGGLTQPTPRLKQCMGCHHHAGLRSLGDLSRRIAPKLHPLTRAKVVEDAIQGKAQDVRWAALKRYGRSKSEE